MDERKDLNQDLTDAKEFIELLQGVTETEKAQVKGILIGMQLSKEQAAAASA